MNTFQINNEATPPFNFNQKGLMFIPFKKFGKFQSVFDQGKLANKLFMVKTGMVKIVHVTESGNQLIREIKTDGEVFGEWKSMFNSNVRFQNSAITLSANTEILCLNLSPFGLENVSTLLSDLSQMILDQNERQQIRYQMLLLQSAEYRIKENLRELAMKVGQRFGEETLLKVWLSHEDIALLADTSRQTVTTVMNGLKKSGKITYSRDRMLFRNLNKIHH
jgi:CRP/FNR family transcriptional regulator